MYGTIVNQGWIKTTVPHRNHPTSFFKLARSHLSFVHMSKVSVAKWVRYKKKYACVNKNTCIWKILFDRALYKRGIEDNSVLRGITTYVLMEK